MKDAKLWPLLFAVVLGASAPPGVAGANVRVDSRHVAEERSNEPGPAWDPRPAWQRAGDEFWYGIFRRRPVEREAPSTIVPVVDRIPFRIPRAMNAVPREFAEPAQPMDQAASGTLTVSPCKSDARGQTNRSNTAQESRMAAQLNKLLAVVRRDPAFPPPGHNVVVQCSVQKRPDASGFYHGKLLILLYPTGNRLHLWHGALEITVNDLGLMGPRANDQDRTLDNQLVFPLPDPATYLGQPYLGPRGGAVWGGIYLSKRPADIYRPLTYKEWLDANLGQLESTYKERQSHLRPKATVTEQVALRNVRAAYDRAVLTKSQMPSNEQDAPLWLAPEGPSDAANYNAQLNVRLNTPGYLDRSKPPTSIQLINIIPVDLDYNPVRALLQNLNFDALKQVLE